MHHRFFGTIWDWVKGGSGSSPPRNGCPTGYVDGAPSALAIGEAPKELGLQPWPDPERLDPIDEDEIDLVVWMGVRGV